jgi:hypothetical protein
VSPLGKLDEFFGEHPSSLMKREPLTSQVSNCLRSSPAGERQSQSPLPSEFRVLSVTPTPGELSFRLFVGHLGLERRRVKSAS